MLAGLYNHSDQTLVDVIFNTEPFFFNKVLLRPLLTDDETGACFLDQTVQNMYLPGMVRARKNARRLFEARFVNKASFAGLTRLLDYSPGRISFGDFMENVMLNCDALSFKQFMTPTDKSIGAALLNELVDVFGARPSFHLAPFDTYKLLCHHNVDQLLFGLMRNSLGPQYVWPYLRDVMITLAGDASPQQALCSVGTWMGIIYPILDYITSCGRDNSVQVLDSRVREAAMPFRFVTASLFYYAEHKRAPGDEDIPTWLGYSVENFIDSKKTFDLWVEDGHLCMQPMFQALYEHPKAKIGVFLDTAINLKHMDVDVKTPSPLDFFRFRPDPRQSAQDKASSDLFHRRKSLAKFIVGSLRANNPAAVTTEAIDALFNVQHRYDQERETAFGEMRETVLVPLCLPHNLSHFTSDFHKNFHVIDENLFDRYVDAAPFSKDLKEVALYEWKLVAGNTWRENLSSIIAAAMMTPLQSSSDLLTLPEAEEMSEDVKHWMYIEEPEDPKVRSIMSQINLLSSHAFHDAPRTVDAGGFRLVADLFQRVPAYRNSSPGLKAYLATFHYSFSEDDDDSTILPLLDDSNFCELYGDYYYLWAAYTKEEALVKQQNFIKTCAAVQITRFKQGAFFYWDDFMLVVRLSYFAQVRPDIFEPLFYEHAKNLATISAAVSTRILFRLLDCQKNACVHVKWNIVYEHWCAIADAMFVSATRRQFDDANDVEIATAFLKQAVKKQPFSLPTNIIRIIEHVQCRLDNIIAQSPDEILVDKNTILDLTQIGWKEDVADEDEDEDEESEDEDEDEDEEDQHFGAPRTAPPPSVVAPGQVDSDADMLPDSDEEDDPIEIDDPAQGTALAPVPNEDDDAIYFF